MARPEKRGFRYQGRTADDVKERANAGGYDTYIKPKFKRYKIKDGKNLIRILPATWEGAKHYGIDVWLNYGVGPDNNTFLSLSKHGKGKDPIAEARLEAQGDDDEELAKELRPRQRILLWVIDRMDEDEGPQIMDAPVTLDKAFADVSFDEDTGEIVPLDHHTRGCDVRFYRTGKGLNTKYEGSKVRLLKPSRISEDAEQQQQWLDFITENPLPEVLNFYDYKHISQVFNGSVKSKRDDDEDDDMKPKRTRVDEDEDDDAPPPKAKAKAKPGKKRPADDDDDDDDEPDADDNADDEDETDTERLRRLKKRKAAAAAAADEDEDEDDDPPPRKKKRQPVDEDEDDASDDEDEDDDPPPRKKAKAKPVDDEDEDDDAPPPKKGTSLRDKIKSRKRSVESDDD